MQQSSDLPEPTILPNGKPAYNKSQAMKYLGFRDFATFNNFLKREGVQEHRLKYPSTPRYILVEDLERLKRSMVIEDGQ